MTLFRLAAYFMLAQCCVAGAAFAGDLPRVPEPTSLALLAAGVGGIALGRKFLKRK